MPYWARTQNTLSTRESPRRCCTRFRRRKPRRSCISRSRICGTTTRLSPFSPSLPSLLTSLSNGRLWQLLYQTFVFLSRSSLSLFHLPPLPLSLLPLPTLLQLAILSLLLLEASTSAFVKVAGEAGATWITAGLVCAEGLCGGAAYVNAFHRLATMAGGGGEEGDREEGEMEGAGEEEGRRRKQEKEFVRSHSSLLSRASTRTT